MIFGGFFGTLALALTCQATLAAETAKNPWTFCAKATSRIERQEGIPRLLLRAISKAESGRFHKGRQVVMAWPWTVMAEGRGRYLDSKAEAIAEVENLRARGVKNIDVGCMQINLMHHPDAFASLDEAFDPLTNVRYAASFLKSLAADQGSWAKAAAYYHSQTPARYRVYRAKVRQIWAQERERYLLALAAFRAEQAAALGSASLLRIDTPLAADHRIVAPGLPALMSTKPVGATLVPAAFMAAMPVRGREELGESSIEASPLGFARAGPVRVSVDSRLM